jgi:ketosteroid isomerase-like protein
MDLAEIKRSIEGGNLKFGEAVRRSDGPAIAALYTEDAKLMPPNSEMIKGNEGIKAFWTGGLQMGIKDAVLTTLEVVGIGDLVCEIGKYDLTIQPAGQGVIKDFGKYVVIWKRTAEGWKLHVDIWNTNRPA